MRTKNEIKAIIFAKILIAYSQERTVQNMSDKVLGTHINVNLLPKWFKLHSSPKVHSLDHKGDHKIMLRNFDIA